MLWAWHTLQGISIECLNVIFAFHHITSKACIGAAIINSTKTILSQLLNSSHGNLLLLCFLWWFYVPLPCIIVSHHWNHLPVLGCNKNYSQGDKNDVHTSFMWSLGNIGLQLIVWIRPWVSCELLWEASISKKVSSLLICPVMLLVGTRVGFY